MSSDFDTWVASLHIDEPDEGADVGTLSPGTMQFFREAFDAAGGPVPTSALSAAWKQRERALADHAVTLIAADLHRTTQLNPNIEVRSLDDGVTAVIYNGNYQTPALSAIRDPEATCDVADNLRDHIVEDLRSPWPTCPTHGSVLDPRPVDGQAAWYCRAGTHAVSAIGALSAGKRPRDDVGPGATTERFGYVTRAVPRARHAGGVTR